MASENTNQFVEESQLFKALDPDSRQCLYDSGTLVTFRPGEVILQEGEEGDCFYLLRAGEVEVTTQGLGHKVELATLSAGAIFGEVPAFSHKPRTATVTAISPVKAVRIENETLKELLTDHPRARAELEALILDRARDTIEKTIGS